jgi:Subtilase family/PA domain
VSRRPRRRRPPLALGVAALLAAAPPAAAAQTAPGDAPAAPGADAAAVRSAALDAAAGWRDTLEARRAPQLPTPGDTESVILLLRDPPAAAADAEGRAAAARAVTEGQDALAPVLASLGATVTFRARVLVNAIGVRLPSGRLESLARLPEVAAVAPVAFLAPAQAGPAAAPAPLPAARARARRAAGAATPAHIALIDAGIDASHPWLGGGIGPTFPVIGGEDLIDRDGDPSADPGDPAAEAHGTQMASLVLRSPALADLPAARAPRLLVYRVVAREAAGGRLRPLARTDRVLAALERAVDPNGDGDTRDAAQVILMGLAGGFDGGGVDPVARALVAADRVGSTVVAPAGNDGPTYARPGAVGGAAAAPTAIAVGGLSAPLSPRTADLEAILGPASARLGPLPLMGPDPDGAALPVVLLRAPDGLATGDSREQYRGPDGASLVTGALAVAARGGGTIAEKAAQAAAAGAAALAVWDVAGPPGFPAVPDGGLPIPVVGMGSQQGQALAGLAADRQGLTVALRAGAVSEAPRGIASFSSWGPTADGRQKPDLVAPAVAREAAWPGRGPDGAPREAALTGTSAAAAEVAARALRLRIDRPELGPRAVHSLLVQAAAPLHGVSARRQGAGVLQPPGDPALRIDPPIVAGRPAGDGAVARVVLADLSGRPGRYAVSLRTGAGEAPLGGGAARLRAGGRAELTLRLPDPDALGTLVVRPAAGGEIAARAPLLPARPARTPADALSNPQIRADSGLAEVLVRVGMLRREDGRVRSVRLHGLRLELVSDGSGAVQPVAGTKQAWAWPAGTYRFLVARRLASGLDVAPGTYRVRVTARGPDGAVLRRESGPFSLG